MELPQLPQWAWILLAVAGLIFGKRNNWFGLFRGAPGPRTTPAPSQPPPVAPEPPVRFSLEHTTEGPEPKEATFIIKGPGPVKIELAGGKLNITS